jgi:hypothetical protein
MDPSVIPTPPGGGGAPALTYGYWPSGGGGPLSAGSGVDSVLNHETQLGRKVGSFKRYLDFSGFSQNGANMLKGDVLVMARGGTMSTGERITGGRVPYLNFECCLFNKANKLASLPTPAGSTAPYGGGGTNDAYTYLQVGQVSMAGVVTTAGVLDALLDIMVSAITAFGDLVFFSFDHELDVLGARRQAALRGTTNYNEYAGAYRYIVKYFRDHGVTNVMFLWCVSGFKPGGPALSIYQQSYPGDGWMDAIGWDPYDHGDQATTSASNMQALCNKQGWYTQLDANAFTPAFQTSHAYTVGQVVSPITPNGHAYLVTVAGTSAGSSPTWPTTSGTTVTSGGVTFKEFGSDSNSKPRFLGEFGCGYRNNGTRATTFMRSLAPAAAAYPKFFLWMYFARGSWGDLHTYSGNSPTSTWDQASISEMAKSTTGLNNAVFLPTPATNHVAGYRVYEGATLKKTQTSGLTANPILIPMTGFSVGSHPNITYTAIDDSGTPLESPHSSAITVVIPSVTPTKPAAPSIGVDPAPQAPQAILKILTQPSGISLLRQYRSLDGGGTFTAHHTVPPGTLQDPTSDLNNTQTPPYQFYYTAVDSTGTTESDPSNIVSYDTTVAVNPKPLALTSVTPTITPISGSRSDVSFAIVAPSDPIRSAIFVYTSDPSNLDNPPTPVYRLAAGATTALDPSVPANTTVNYYFVAVTSVGTLGPITTVTVTTPPPTTVQAILQLSPTVLILPDASGTSFVQVTMDASASIGGVGRTLTYTYSVDDDSPDVGGPGITSQIRNLYAAQEYHVHLHVVDDLGNFDDDYGTVTVAPYGGLTLDIVGTDLLVGNVPFAPASNIQAKRPWATLQRFMIAVNALFKTLIAAPRGYAIPTTGDIIYPDNMVVAGTPVLGSGYQQVANWCRFRIPNGMLIANTGLIVQNNGTSGTQVATLNLYADDGTGRRPSGVPLATDGTIDLTTGTTSAVRSPASPVTYQSVGQAGGWQYIWGYVQFAFTGSPSPYPTVNSVSQGLFFPGPSSTLFPRGLTRAATSTPNPLDPASMAGSGAPICIVLIAG